MDDIRRVNTLLANCNQVFSLGLYLIRKMHSHYGWHSNAERRILTPLLTFFDIYSSKVIIIAENVPILNKSPAEQNLAAFNMIFGIDH